MNQHYLVQRAKIRQHKDGSFSVLARDLTGTKIVVKQGIAPFNRRIAVNEARMFNMRLKGFIQRGEIG